MEPSTVDAASLPWKREVLSRALGILALMTFGFVPVWTGFTTSILPSAFVVSRWAVEPVTWPEALENQWTRVARSLDAERAAIASVRQLDPVESITSRVWAVGISLIPLSAVVIVLAPRTHMRWLSPLAAALGTGSAASCLLHLELEEFTSLGKRTLWIVSLAPLAASALAGHGLVARRPWATASAFAFLGLTALLLSGFGWSATILWGAPLVPLLLGIALVLEASTVRARAPESEGAPGDLPDAP